MTEKSTILQIHFFFVDYHKVWLIDLVDRMFTYDLGDMGSITGLVIPKTLKIVLDDSLLNTQQYQVRIKGKVEQSIIIYHYFHLEVPVV